MADSKMTSAVRLSREILEDARKNAQLNFRTIPKQIEYWYRLGKLADENSDCLWRLLRAPWKDDWKWTEEM
jgi:hypothetical protein